jgi:hypothetical protein
MSITKDIPSMSSSQYDRDAQAFIDAAGISDFQLNKP